MFDLSDYEDWAADEARATLILLGSMKVELAMDLASLPSTRVMWECATELYQSKSHALYISVDSRTPPSTPSPLAYCRSCGCCRLRQEHDNVLRFHEFLRRLRLEFEQLRAKLLARSPLSTMVEVVTLARAEEIRLRGVLSSFATVLATMTSSTTSTPVPAMPSTPTSAGPVTHGGTAATLFCNYCKSKTHEIELRRRRPSHRKGA
jgi:hypothetical protein